jgi:hypothetical protein
MFCLLVANSHQKIQVKHLHFAHTSCSAQIRLINSLVSGDSSAPLREQGANTWNSPSSHKRARSCQTRGEAPECAAQRVYRVVILLMAGTNQVCDVRRDEVHG